MKKHVDYTILLSIITLTIIGIFMVYSASSVVSSYKFNDQFYFLKRQLLFCFVGYAIMFFIIKIDMSKIQKQTGSIFIICLFLLLVVLIPGIGVVRGGARSWIGVGSFSIQPAEFMKLGLIMMLSTILSEYSDRMKKFKNFIIVLILILLVFGIILLQPDFGTGLVIVVSSLLLLFATEAKYKFFLLLMLLGILGLTGLIISAPYRLERITAFLNPWNDPLGSGFQGIQSLFAIAPTGLFGLGFNNSIQKHFFLPEPQNDFIFAILVEEMGYLGAIFVLILFLIIILRTLKISLNINNKYYKYLLIGLGLSLFTQVFINIGVVIGLLPVTGITLPFISYGGSSLILTLITGGLILNISKYEEY